VFVHNISQFNEQIETLLDHALAKEAVASGAALPATSTRRGAGRLGILQR
jgi:hypothetical protein